MRGDGPPAGARAKGLAITALGVLILTPDGLLVRLAATEPMTLAMLRGLLQAAGTLLVVLVLRGRATPQAFRALGRPGLWLSLVYGLGNLLFVLALDNTSVANVLVFLATIPLFSALLGWLILRERLPLRTWAAIAAAFAGIAVVAGDSLGQPTLAGDSAALGAAFCFAFFFVLVRKRPDVDMIPAVALSGVTSALIALPLMLSLEGLGPLQALDRLHLLWVAIPGLVILPVSFACIVTGPRYLPAAEVGLIMLLETVLGPFWVWLVLGEEPRATTLLGGGIVLTTLAWHTLASRR